MKNLLGIIILAAIMVSSCSKPNTHVKLANENDSISYMLGLYYAKGAKQTDLPKINPIAVARAFDEVFAGDSIKLTEEAIQMKLNTYFMKLQEEVGKKIKAEGEKFLSENKSKPGVITLPSGLQYEVIKEGTGPIPDSSDMVSVHYNGTLIDGTVFDSSIKRGTPAKFAVTGVIRAWTEALLKMKVGSKWKLYVPSELGYGNQRVSKEIKANSTLIFEMELLGIEPKQPKPAEQPMPSMGKPRRK